MTELSQRVMEKVKRVYLARRVGVFGAKCIAIIAALYISSIFVSFGDVLRNLKNVLGQGDVFTYMVDAFSKTETGVLILSALVVGIGVAALMDIRKMVAGLSTFAR